MTQVATSQRPVSGAGRAEFREWVKAGEGNGVRRADYQLAVASAQRGHLALHGTFGGVEVYFYANEYTLGAVLIDPATMEAWYTTLLLDTFDVRRWADECGLNPRMGGR